MSAEQFPEVTSTAGRARHFARTRRRERSAQPAFREAGATFLFGGDPSNRLVAPEWPKMAIPMALALAGLALFNLSIPTILPALLALLALVATHFSSIAVKIESERKLETGQRLALMGLAVALPMFLFGSAMGFWGESGQVAWFGCLAVVVTTGVLATVVQSGRLVAVIAAQVGIWSGVTCVASRAGGYFALVLGVAIAIAAYLRQRKIDLHARKKSESDQRAQTRAEEILADYEETGQGWFWETDRRGHLAYLSSPVAAILGRRVEELVGRPFSELFNLTEQSGEGERTLAFHLSARSSFSELAVRAATRDEERWWSITGRPTYDTFNNFAGFRGSGTDLTEKRRSQEHASRLAHFDSLTGLSNRFRMSQTLEKILLAPQVQHRACAVFLLDLDRFKQVNDTLGHPAGDALLKQVAQRLERVVGKIGRVGRLGGDEFEVILPGKMERGQLGHMAGRIIESLSQPYSIEGSRVMIGASVGIALAPDDGVTSEALIRNADLALYAAKDGGRGRFHFYAPDLHSDAEERRQMEEDLRDAVSNGGLELYYQPVVRTATEKITGFEALLRWNHPEHGWISPARFIPIAEDTGLIATIGEWALRTACQDLARWPENVRVAVNVSPLQFANPSLPVVVTNALATAQVAAERLELEITESVFLNDDEGTDQMFKSLKAIGVRLALDDFGTGYSSLGYLRSAPFDKIKIDQSFVRGATQPGSRNGAIIASIVSLAEALGMETTAEGVETLDELDLVRMLGCSHVQGYIYERPLSAMNAAARLSTGLMAIAQGPRSARAARQSMLRKVILDHGGHRYDAMVRNISQTGALIEGLWNVPAGTIFRILIADNHVVTGTCRWSADDRMGVEFSVPLRLDENGRIAAVAAPVGVRFAIAEQEVVASRKVG
ncbi:diguanylate cyclase/phosphodiesterase with PAS/PAC sensor(s) [Novosphingobium aromaticivorans DSM 12444]|uniref:Diguanylate cyclase/phosphodiesterase with PAS/PAC sensor(S) n=1 Tax=Novosphingobium aromaticivorans (strain ATCC 700278 / DSM 12444 / CCUG 56034 / CIP 105152 / NBRC 16084 / F199) TaxID=279238 RepID=Q2G8E4_NOVAD|nr:EAL domain-containing protein [Novosphingobium aromaticivorans]ABD25879.1 diguanylate cyclase/phosphodiesterase with PAS/PAC sensor(s) [Novosphingobium aromaticivorans DSM 12444]SCY06604.1 diguanylate cyclase/phosphodiesterase with PAS/PAC sensor(s) [Novosphingobium aromaticivorans]